MKRVITCLCIVILAAVAIPAFAQDAASGRNLDTSGSIRQPSELYPVRLDVVRVFSHAQGYRVIYRKGQAALSELYVPIGWFVAGGQAQLIRVTGPHIPYAMVYYRADGSFSHLKLYVHPNVRDQSWGEIRGDPGDAFKVDTIKLDQ
jgi:hypothetical protein